MAKTKEKEKLKAEIIASLSELNEITYFLDDSQNILRNRIYRELRKIHTRVEKLAKNN